MADGGARAGGWATAVSVGRLHIVAIAALGALTFGWLFSGHYLWLVVGVCAVDWFVVNLLNRVVDLAEDEANGIVGTAFVARHKRPVFAVGLALLVGTVALTHLVSPRLTPLRLGYHLLGFAYNWPILPFVGRLKALYFWKNTASAVGFLLTVFGYPLAFASSHPAGPLALPAGITPTTVVITATFFFLFELSYEVIYDLRDAPGDALAGVRTYPVVHGERAALGIIDGLLGTSSLILLSGYVAGVVPWRIVVMLLAPALQAVLYKRAYRRGITSADCIRITWLGAGLLFGYHAWIWAGLPGVTS
jgi:4-hydroxybenzoate polyprenyltransferase